MSNQPLDSLDLHGERAALRGNPSFVWRAGQDRRLNLILAWAKHGNDEHLGNVLVNGCGVGMYVKALLPYADTVHGIDIEPQHLEYAAQAVPQAKLQLAACEALPYPDNFFDLVLSHEVIEHVTDDRAAAVEMVRVLKPGGRLFVLEFSKPRNNVLGGLFRFYFHRVMPAVGRLVSRDSAAYTYLPKSVDAFPDGVAFVRILEKCGLREAKAEPLTGGIATLYEARK